MQRFLLALMIFSCTAAAWGEAKPFAPCAPLSQAATEMLQTTGWNPCQGIPGQATVGAPAYPGARISAVSGGGFNLPSVTLLSADPEAKVLAFYKQALTPQQGWKWNEDLKLFYRGDSVLDGLTGKVPSVQINDVSGEGDSFFLVDKAFREKVQSKIVIAYSPAATAGASQ
jgi:hypothetical protein